MVYLNIDQQHSNSLYRSFPLQSGLKMLPNNQKQDHNINMIVPVPKLQQTETRLILVLKGEKVGPHSEPKMNPLQWSLQLPQPMPQFGAQSNVQTTLISPTQNNISFLKNNRICSSSTIIFTSNIAQPKDSDNFTSFVQKNHRIDSNFT